MRTTLRRLLCATAIWLAATAAFCQTAAKTDGLWSDPSIWTGGSTPSSSDSVYIGSTTPSGAARTATVTLTADASAMSLILGRDRYDTGTLDLGNYNLHVGGTFQLGRSGGRGNVIRGAGSLSASQLYVNSGNALSFGTRDAVGELQIFGGAQATTANVGNVTGNAILLPGSTLTLGADMALTNTFSAENSAATTFDMGGHALSANVIQLGGSSGIGPTLLNRGALRASSLSIGGQTLDIGPDVSARQLILNNSRSTLNDSVEDLQLTQGSAATTTPTGSVTKEVRVNSASTLTLGADMALQSFFWVQDNSVVDAVRHSITSDSVYLGRDGTGRRPRCATAGRCTPTRCTWVTAARPRSIPAGWLITHYRFPAARRSR